MPMTMVTTPSTRSMVSACARIVEPISPNSAPCTTSTALKPSTNSSAPATMRFWLGRSSVPDSPAT